jgi:DNA polymerase-3 subunit alpha
VLIRGAVSNRERDEEEPPLFLDSAVALSEIRNGGDVGVQIELGSDGPTPDALDAARGILAEHAGPGHLIVVWRNGGTEATKLKSKTVKVAPRDELLMALRETLGAERVTLHRDERPLVTVQREQFPRRGGRGGGGGGSGYTPPSEE